MQPPIKQFLQSEQERDLFLEFPFLPVDINQIIDSYEQGAREGQTEASLLASVYGDIQEQHEAAGAMNDSGNTYGGTKSLTLDTDDIPNNPFSDCIGASVDLGAGFEPCGQRLMFKNGNLPMPSFLSIFDDLIAQIESFIEKMGRLLNKAKFLEEVCMMVDAMRFMCPQDLHLMLASMRFRIAQIIIQSLKFDFDMMAVVGLLIFPIFLLSYISFDTIGQIAKGPLQCAIQFLDSFKDLRLGVSADIAPALDEGAFGFTSEPLLPVDPNANDSASEAVWNTPSTVSNLTNTTPPPDELEGTKAKIGEAQKGVDRAAEISGQVADEIESASRIPSDFLRSGVNRSAVAGSLTCFDTAIAQLIAVEQQITELTDVWRTSCKAILGLLTKSMADKMNVILQIVEIIRLIQFIEAMIRALNNQDVCVDPTVPLSPEDVVNVLDNIPGIEVSTDGDNEGSVPDVVTVNLNAAGSLVVNDPVLNQTFTIPTCLGAVPESLQTEIATWIEELDNSGV